jgi:hypothetical protein
MLTRKAKLFLSLTAATPLVFAACTDNSIFNPMVDASGTYQLTVYAGKSIPANYTIQPGDPNYPQYPNGATFSVTGGTMVLNSNGTFIETNYYVTTPTGQASQNTNFVRTGTWTLSGTNLTLSIPAQNGRLALYDSGTLDLNTINYQEDGGSGVGLQQYEYKR